MHPQDSSCLVFKAKRATLLLPCSFFMEGTLPVALTMFTKPPTVLNIHKSTPHLYLNKTIYTKSNPFLHTGSMYSEKIYKETFQKLQKSVFSNQAHHAPPQTDILYIRVVLPKDTPVSTPQRPITVGTLLLCVCIYIHIQIHTQTTYPKTHD